MVVPVVGAVVPGAEVAEEAAEGAVPFRPANNEGLDPGAVVVGAVPPNRLDAGAPVVEVGLVPKRLEVVVVAEPALNIPPAGAGADEEGCVLGVLAGMLLPGKLKVDFGAWEAVAGVAVAPVAELAGVACVLNRLLGPLVAPADGKRELVVAGVEDVVSAFDPPKPPKEVWPPPNSDFGA